jgi:hypothetical protein
MPVLSTLSTFDPMPTLALILAPQSGPARLDAILADPFLRSLFQGTLNARALEYKISLSDITAHLNDDANTTYTLDTDIAGSLFSTFKKLIQVITCAANNFNPNIDIISLPSNLPKGAVASLGMPDPVTSWGALSTSINPLTLEFHSVANIFKMFKKLQDIANFLFGWIAEAVKTSVLQGEGSRWNFGSYFGLTFEEFIARILPIVQANPYWSVLPGLVQCYDAITAKKDFEFILNSAAHASDVQLVRTTRTRLLYGTVPYTPVEKHDLTEQFSNLSIFN